MTTEPYQTPAQAPAAAGSSPGGRGLIVAGIVTVVAGVVLGIVSLILLVGGAVGAYGDQLTAPVLTYPGSTSLSLSDSGSYLVFQSTDDTVPLGPSDISIAAPDGSAIAVGEPSIDESVTRGLTRFDAVAQFEVPAAGSYDVTVHGSSDISGQMIVARGAGAAVADRGWWGLGIGGAVLVVIVGIVLLAFGLTRRRRDRTAAAVATGGYAGQQYAPQQYAPQPYPPQQYAPQPYPPQPYPPQQYPSQQYAPQPAAAQVPPAGWYPDPDPARPGGQRYWDGSAWTGYTA